MSVSLDFFKTQIEFLKSNGFVFKGLEDFLSTNDKSILIVFDDGHKSILEASDYLSSQNIPFGVSVIFDRLNDKNHLSIEDLKGLTKNNDIYYHGKAHKSLSNLNLIGKKQEIVDGKNELEKLLKIKIDTFVYPFGVLDAESIEIVKQNYKYGLSLLPFHYNKNSNIFMLPRINIRGDMDFKKFKFFLGRFGDTYLRASFFIKKLKGINYLENEKS